MTQTRQRKKKSTGKLLLFSIFTFLIVIFIVTISVFKFYPFPSKEQVAYLTGDNPIIYDGQQVSNAIESDGVIYVSRQFLIENIDDSIWFDEKSASIIITRSNKVVQMPTDSLTVYINEDPVDLHIPALKFQDDDYYVALNILLDYYAITYIQLDNGAILIQDDGDLVQLGKITDKKINEDKLKLRTGNEVTTPYTDSVSSDEEVFIEKEGDTNYYVRKKNGIAGYLKKDYVIKTEVKNIVAEVEKWERNKDEFSGSINLTWEAVYSRNPDVNSLPEMPGVNVVSPTWFELLDKNGTVKNMGSLEYINWAKANNYRVWGLFSNGFDPQLTYEALKDFETRQVIIKQLLHYSKMYHLDGINIDIENVNAEHGPLVTQFVREATPYFHDANLDVSMDVTFIAEGNWSSFYEREKLASIVDYMIVMAYDEHWASSPIAGSVASMPWVEANLNRILEEIPNDKLVLGVPLYARLWKEEENEDGSVSVSSQALSMDKISAWIEERELTPSYDDESGQNYVEYYDTEEKATFKIWLEDELSLQKRAEIVSDYELAGIASWARVFANEKAWHAMDNFPNKNNESAQSTVTGCYD